jgi:hypothetical protein
MAKRRKLTAAERALNASRRRYGYKGLPGIGVGTISPLPVAADETAPVFGELFSMFRNLGQEIFRRRFRLQSNGGNI